MKKVYLILLGILALHLFLLFNLRFTAWPEMISYPYFLNNGFGLYRDMVHPYPPLLTMILSFIYKLFGYELLVLKFFTWVIVLANDLLIFAIVKKLAKDGKWALVSVFSYVLVQPFLEGNQLWFDLAIVPFGLAGFLFFVNKKYLLSGLVIALAALIKQTVGLYLIFGLVYLLLGKERIKSYVSFLVTPVILGGVLVAWLIANGTLEHFLNWTLIYPFTFWNKFPGYVQMQLTNGQILTLGIVLLPVLIIVFKNIKAIVKDRDLVLLLGSLVLSFVLVYPRFSFFHFQLALSFSAIAFGVLYSRFKLSPVILATFGMLILFGIVLPTASRNWGLEARFWGKADLALAQEISEKAEGKSIFLLGEPSSMYVFSNTVPPKPWLDNYGWYFEAPEAQRDTISMWEKSPPTHVLWHEPGIGNWYDLGVYQPKEVTAWITTHYNRIEELRPGTWLWAQK